MVKNYMHTLAIKNNCTLYMRVRKTWVWFFPFDPDNTLVLLIGFLPLWQNRGCTAQPVQLFIQRRLNPFKSALLDSHLCLWALAGGWVLEADCPSLQQNRALLRRAVLFLNFFSGISFYQLPPPSPPLRCTALHHPPSVWRPCQTFWHMKTIARECLRKHKQLLRQAGLRQKLSWCSDRQTSSASFYQRSGHVQSNQKWHIWVNLDHVLAHMLFGRVLVEEIWGGGGHKKSWARYSG